MVRVPTKIRSAEGQAEYRRLGEALAQRQITNAEFVEQAKMIRDSEARRALMPPDAPALAPKGDSES